VSSGTVKDKSYEDDPQLISGFFAAILTFAETTAGNSDTISNLLMQKKSYYFLKHEGYYFILETDNLNQNLTEDDFNALLIFISDCFHEKFLKNNVKDLIEIIEDDEFTSEIQNKISKMIRKKLFTKFT
jgi:hypothetical protein